MKLGLQKLAGRVLLSGCLLGSLAANVLAEDWTEYRGPTHDSVSKETIAPWTSEPKLLWKVKMGEGFGTYAVVGNQAFLTCETGGKEACIALDVKTGATLWTTPLGKTIFEKQGGNGPRSTPAVDGDLVYVLGTYMTIACMNKSDGKMVWGHDFTAEYKSEGNTTSGIKAWGSAASPVIDGDLIFVVSGAPKGSLMAFNKKTGKGVWATGNEKLTHASPAIATIHGIRQVIFFVQSGLVSCDVATGKELWRYAFPFSISTAASPIVFEDIVYCSAGYGVGAGAAKISKAGNGLAATELWRTKGQNINHWSTPVCKDGYLYGLYGFKEYGTEPLKCLDIRTGKVLWSHDGFGQGGAQLVGDKLIVQGDAGQIVMVQASPEGYKELGRTKPFDGKCWNMPVVSGGKLFARTTKEAACLDVSGK